MQAELHLGRPSANFRLNKYSLSGSVKHFLKQIHSVENIQSVRKFNTSDDSAEKKRAQPARI